MLTLLSHQELDIISFLSQHLNINIFQVTSGILTEEEELEAHNFLEIRVRSVVEQTIPPTTVTIDLQICHLTFLVHHGGVMGVHFSLIHGCLQ